MEVPCQHFFEKNLLFFKKLENGVKWVDVRLNVGHLGRSATDTVKDVRDSVKFGGLWE